MWFGRYALIDVADKLSRCESRWLSQANVDLRNRETEQGRQIAAESICTEELRNEEVDERGE